MEQDKTLEYVVPKQRRDKVKVLGIRLDYSTDPSREIELTYTLRYGSITIENLREMVHFEGWPEDAAEDVGANRFNYGYPSQHDGLPLHLVFSEACYDQVRYHLNVWLLQIYARLLQVYQPDTDYTTAVINEANATARAFGYEFENGRE
jgi:hypothetical protein